MFEHSFKPLVKRLIGGHSSTIIVSGPQRNRTNKMVYRLNPSGLLMQIYDSTEELFSLLRKGGKYAKSEFSLRARGFNVAGELRTDVFTLNPLDDGSSKSKSLKLESRDDMINFCKICRNSVSVLKAALQRPEMDDDVIQCLQLTFEVKTGKYPSLNQSDYPEINLNNSEDNCDSRIRQDEGASGLLQPSS
jgi:hypothetical protein